MSSRPSIGSLVPTDQSHRADACRGGALLLFVRRGSIQHRSHRGNVRDHAEFVG
jgi:hypothetical protein